MSANPNREIVSGRRIHFSDSFLRFAMAYGCPNRAQAVGPRRPTRGETSIYHFTTLSIFEKSSVQSGVFGLATEGVQ
jgi:hypothetical protein